MLVRRFDTICAFKRAWYGILSLWSVRWAHIAIPLEIRVSNPLPRRATLEKRIAHRGSRGFEYLSSVSHWLIDECKRQTFNSSPREKFKAWTICYYLLALRIGPLWRLSNEEFAMRLQDATQWATQEDSRRKLAPWKSLLHGVESTLGAFRCGIHTI